ncbi:MAG: tRNA1(Val) (adenine(37)-N6)-methyltransferase [Arenibacterium sp.]
MEHWDDAALSQDGFLGGRLKLLQPAKGYRAGNDPVLLAASVPVRSGQSLLDMGCGVGTAALCVGTRVSDVRLTGIERLPAYAELAERNASENDIPFDVFCGDLTHLPSALRQRQFDHVVANPPYFRAGAHAASQDAGRAAGRGEKTPLSAWIETGAKRLRTRGMLHLIQAIERLPDVLSAAQGYLGSLEILPLASRNGRAPDRFILRAVKGGRAAFRLWPALILHEGVRHETVGNTYTNAVNAVLRDGVALEWPNDDKR